MAKASTPPKVTPPPVVTPKSTPPPVASSLNTGQKEQIKVVLAERAKNNTPAPKVTPPSPVTVVAPKPAKSVLDLTQKQQIQETLAKRAANNVPVTVKNPNPIPSNNNPITLPNQLPKTGAAGDILPPVASGTGIGLTNIKIDIQPSNLISLDSKNISAYDYFRFADNAYVDPLTKLPDGWKDVSNNKEFKDLVHRTDGYDAAVFINEKTKQVMISHRGTELFSGKDWEQDIELAFRTKDMVSQYSSATELSNAVNKQYAAYNIQHTGHSLGGWLAEGMGIKYSQRVTSFDSPRTYEGVDKDTKNFAEQNIVSYRSNLTFANMIGKDYGNLVIRINDGNLVEQPDWSIFNSHVRDYLVKFFDPKTGGLIKECLQSDVTPKTTYNAPDALNFAGTAADKPVGNPLERLNQNNNTANNGYQGAVDGSLTQSRSW